MHPLSKIAAISLVISCGLGQGVAPYLKALRFSARISDAPESRQLLIEAEDLGMAHSIDKATFEALDKGYVTSAGILTPAPWFPEVAFWANQHRQADLGVQLDLTSDWKNYCWRAVSPQAAGSSLLDSTGYFPLTEAYVARHAKPEEAEREARAQIELALKTGVPMTHLDNHMRVMLMTPDLFRIYWSLGQGYKVPVVVQGQQVRSQGKPAGAENVFSFGGVDVNVLQVPVDHIVEMMPGIAKEQWLNAYEKTLAALPPGVYLLSVHLGYNDEELQAMTWDHPNWGAQWRQNDLDVVSSPEFRKFLKDQHFTLVTWRDLVKATPQAAAWK